MTKELHKAIMKKSKLRNAFLKSEIFSYRKACISQRNLCKKLFRNARRTYFNNLNIKKATDKATFWKNFALLFSNKFSRNEKLNLTEKKWNYLRKKKKVFINFFPKAAKELKTQNISNFMQNESHDSLKEALNYFEKKKKKQFCKY